MTLAALLCSIVLVSLGVLERLARDRAWRAMPIRIHVNGTRGKSTVTRLIWSALREAGIPAVGKTTGTAARLLLPDGTERPVTRRGPASIREQLALLRLARRLRARAVVIECMALDPDLQYVSEHQMVRATIGVITNVRTDHTEIMGTSLEQIAATLCNTVPTHGVLVHGEPRFAHVFAARAEAAGTRVVQASTAPIDTASDTPQEPWLADAAAVALAVTRELGIADEVARRGFACAPLDPGAARAGTIAARGVATPWLDATAANDPESLDQLVADRWPHSATASTEDAGPGLVVYNHRVDRPVRLACFADGSRTVTTAEHLVVTGDRPPLTVWRALARSRGGRAVPFVASKDLAVYLSARRTGRPLVFCGNTRGFDVARLIEEACFRD